MMKEEIVIELHKRINYLYKISIQGTEKYYGKTRPKCNIRGQIK